MTYQIASGYDNVAGLTQLDPQPRCPGINSGRTIVSVDGMIYEDGYGNADLIYTVLTKDEYDSLLTQMGLTSVKSAQVTVSLPQNQDRNFSNYNAIITKPDPQYKDFWKDVIFRLTRIEGV